MLFWFCVIFVVACWILSKITGEDKPSSEEASQNSGENVNIARGIGRMMADVGRSVSRIPEGLDRFDAIMTEMDARHEEKRRKENSSFGVTLSHKQRVLDIALQIAKGDRKIRLKMDADPEFEKLFTSNKAKLDALMEEHQEEKATFTHVDLVPAEYRNLRSWSIPFLVHFTRASNLQSILKNGIVPVASCAGMGIVPSVNDIHRFDRRTNSSSFSVAHPNHRMLWKYRQIAPEEEWVILTIDPDVIWTKDCAFCPKNAADRSISIKGPDSLKGSAAFDKMLGARKKNDSLPYEPVDDQAEILIFDVVQPELISGVFFLKDETRERLDAQCGARASFNAFESEALFSSRSYARQLTGNAAMLNDYRKLMEQIIGELKSDPMLAPHLDAAIAEMLDNADNYPASQTGRKVRA